MIARFVRPLLLTALLGLAAWIFARSPLPVVSAQTQVVGSGPNRAGLIVRFDDGRVETRCVAFEEQDIGGDELLQRSGLTDVVIAPDGAVCRIDGKGCPSDDCFCQCPFPNCEYWAYYHRESGGWTYSQAGAALSVITDGSLDGWSWGQGNFSSGVEPPQVTFEQVCPASTESTATPTPTAEAAPTGPPQVTFFAASTVLTTGQCTMLSWQTTDAMTVTLDGVTVALLGSQQVCPTATQAWTLIATNAVGQAMRQVSVTVRGTNPEASSPTPTAQTQITPAAATPTARATVSVPRQATPTPPVRTSQPIVTQAPLPLPGATVGALPGADLPGGGVPLAPTAQPLPVFTPTPVVTATRFEFSLPPTETPRPRRVLSPDDPTPTPILIARAGEKPSGGSGQASAASGPTSIAASTNATSVQSRAFSPSLLPGYAAYVASVAVLLTVGWYVLRRRHARARAQTVGGQDE